MQPAWSRGRKRCLKCCKGCPKWASSVTFPWLSASKTNKCLFWTIKNSRTLEVNKTSRNPFVLDMAHSLKKREGRKNDKPQYMWTSFKFKLILLITRESLKKALTTIKKKNDQSKAGLPQGFLYHSTLHVYFRKPVNARHPQGAVTCCHHAVTMLSPCLCVFHLHYSIL